METTSLFPGLIALLIAALLGFTAAWIWRSKRLTAVEKQAAKLRRERRESAAKMTQASRKFNALNQQRTKAVDALSTLKQQHQALETGHAKLIARYANLKKRAGHRETDKSKDTNDSSDASDKEWFEGLENSSPDDSISQDKRKALKELEEFESQLSTVSDQLVRDNQSALLERHAPGVQAEQVVQPAADSHEADALKLQIAQQEAEIQRLREQMAPLLGLPLAVSTREAERDRLADVLKNKEQEITNWERDIASKDQALADKEQEIMRKQQEIARKQQEIADKDQLIAGKEQAIAGKEQEIAKRAKALESKDQTIGEKQQEIQSAQQVIQSKQLEVQSKVQTIEEKEKEISELNAALRQRSEREATLNRELATAKRAEDAHNEEIRRLAADKDRELQIIQDKLAKAESQAKLAQTKTVQTEKQAKEDDDSQASSSELGNLGREVKDSSAYAGQPADRPMQEATGPAPTPLSKPPTALTGVQAAPLGSTVAVDQASSNKPALRPVNGSASIAAVDRSAANGAAQTEPAAPRQFKRAPSRVDNLKEIKGIGPVLERMLNRLGVYQFRQIAAWSDEDIEYFDTELADFRGRIRRDDWRTGAGAAHNRKYN